MQELGLKFIFEKGSADSHRLDLYDASIALNGIARAVAITTHAFINGEIKKHGQSAHGAQLLLLPTRSGSFIIDATVILFQTAAAGLFYDFLKYSFHEAVGLGDDDQHIQRSLQARIEPTIGELPATLETALDDMHRPIRQDNKMTLTVTRPRGEVLASFDKVTATYLEPRVVPMEGPITGNVTKYNALSRWGKFYDQSLGRTVSFHLGPDITEYERSLITWSLHQSNLGRAGVLYFDGTAVITPTDRVKRYNIVTVTRPA